MSGPGSRISIFPGPLRRTDHQWRRSLRRRVRTVRRRLRRTKCNCRSRAVPEAPTAEAESTDEARPLLRLLSAAVSASLSCICNCNSCSSVSCLPRITLHCPCSTEQRRRARTARSSSILLRILLHARGLLEVLDGGGASPLPAANTPSPEALHKSTHCLKSIASPEHLEF